MATEFDDLPLFLTTQEICKILKTTPRWVYKQVKAKRGPPVYWLGPRMRFRKHEFLSWLETVKN